MDPETASIVKEAVETRLRNETIERAIGRAVRRRGLDFSRYIQVMSAVRELASEKKLSADEAAEGLAEENGKGH
jgi:hypothetical protein